MIEVQRRTAKNLGCAFWDVRGLMAGSGGFARWQNHEPRLASSDLVHLTKDGLELVGQSLADGLLNEYEFWRTQNPDFHWIPEDVEDKSSRPSARRSAQEWEVWVPEPTED